MSLPIEVKDLSFQYEEGAAKILRHLDLSVAKGEIVGIVGLSGIGKSTLCFCLSGIIPHVYGGIMEGEVLLNGQSSRELSLPTIATTLGLVFQNPDHQLFAFNVEDELAFGPENLCVPRAEIARRIEEVLAIVGMQDYRHANPQQLSGGQRQLIAVAAVLCLQPEILIFDEAMSQIDAEGRAKLKAVMLRLKDQGKTMVMIDHDLDNLQIADRVLVLKEGRLFPYTGSLS
ncbi:MAG TPA: ABC transporter ATP-binding protein [Firmicutes bacterium]|nr:ABC transporter ATP-binding protein [Bacillota bacterium]HAA38384.1 ABC transporter ATP-binding protein [Bacillota bacterium]